MANNLQYAVAQVSPYLAVTTGHLDYIGDNLAELVAVKSDRDELAEKVWLLEEEQSKFVEQYLVLSREKTVVEA